MRCKRKSIIFLLVAFLASAANAMAIGETSLHYDELNRLWKVVYDDGSFIQYTYDEIGNRLSSFFDNSPNQPNPGTITINQTSADISWTGGDPDGDAVTYHLYFGTAQNPATEIVAIGQTTYTVQNLDCGTTYYWFVKAVDEHGAERQSTVQSISTAPASPPVKNTSTSALYSTLQSAYNAAQNTNMFQTQVQLSDSLVANKDISVNISGGGYNCDFSSASGMSTLTGSITIISGTVTLGNLIISN